MKLKSLKLYAYSLKAKRPLYIKGKSLDVKEGIILEITSENNVSAYGEIAPLPFFSKETLAQAKKQILSIKPFLLNESIPAHAEKLEEAIGIWVKPFNLYPSVKFGLEMAILNLIANTKKVPLNHLLYKDAHDLVKIHGLVEGTKQEILAQARNLLDQGFTSIKLKVSSDIDEAIAKTSALASLVSEKALLHLDANQSWDVNKGIKFGNEVGLAAVVYIEEPFTNATDIENFFMQTTIPVALDESLLTLDWKNLGPLDGVDIFILKPTILGGIERAWFIKRKGQAMGIETIMSSSFESDIGILTLAQLAGAYAREYYAGLDTLKYFNERLLKNPPAIEHGKMNIKNRFVTKDDINFDNLKADE